MFFKLPSQSLLAFLAIFSTCPFFSAFLPLLPFASEFNLLRFPWCPNSLLFILTLIKSLITARKGDGHGKNKVFPYLPSLVPCFLIFFFSFPVYLAAPGLSCDMQVSRWGIGISFPDQGLNTRPLKREFRVLSTGLWGKSLLCLFCSLF